MAFSFMPAGFASAAEPVPTVNSEQCRNNAEYTIQTGGETNRQGKLVFLTKELYFDLTVNNLMVNKK